MATSPLIALLETKVRAILESSQACHDWDHTQRVRKNAVSIAKHFTTPIDMLVLEAAAILHDIARPQELADHGKTDHAQLGAEMARDLLEKLPDLPPDFPSRVADCIRTHRYRKRNGASPPQSLEAQILFDADKLDSIGAIGIGRSFHFSGHIGSRVHNTKEEATASESYSREDSAYREYLVKLQFIQDAMLTAPGRLIAAQRHAFMVSFFEQLNAECFE